MSIPPGNESKAGSYAKFETMRRRKDSRAVALGKKGGHARARRLSPEERRESARKAALARWKRKKAPEG